jgi:hypothetical protein
MFNGNNSVNGDVSGGVQMIPINATGGSGSGADLGNVACSGNLPIETPSNASGLSVYLPGLANIRAPLRTASFANTGHTQTGQLTATLGQCQKDGPVHMASLCAQAEAHAVHVQG